MKLEWIQHPVSDLVGALQGESTCPTIRCDEDCAGLTSCGSYCPTYCHPKQV